MTDEELKTNIEIFCQQFVGATISASNVSENMAFIKESKQRATSHEWLYHCTNADALKSIIKNREFWLSNLKCVNDKEEARRIDVQEYENTYYVGCFTYDVDITEKHWEEYGNDTNGVLVAIKPSWFIKKAVFMTSSNQKCSNDYKRILKTRQEALDIKKDEQEKGLIINPYYINSFDFYQVIYNDELKKYISGNAVINLESTKLSGFSITPEIGGVIKSTKGICYRLGRPSYEKDWSTEKEVRLKVGIQQLDNIKNENPIHDNLVSNDIFFPKIAVPIEDHAFDTLRIRLCPNFKNKGQFIDELKSLVPDVRIEEI